MGGDPPPKAMHLFTTHTHTRTHGGAREPTRWPTPPPGANMCREGGIHHRTKNEEAQKRAVYSLDARTRQRTGERQRTVGRRRRLSRDSIKRKCEGMRKQRDAHS